VTVDNRAAACGLGRYLAGLGHRRFAFIGPDTPLARQRIAGFRRAASECGGELPDRFTAFCSHTVVFQQAAAMASALAERAAALPPGARFTALAAYNDIVAVGAIRGLAKMGLRVPEDISVVGFDGTEPHTPPLTTVALPLETLGVEAARLIAWRLAHPDAPRRKSVVQTMLIEGETACRPKVSG
jgi:LacI family transcriptional regulator